MPKNSVRTINESVTKNCDKRLYFWQKEYIFLKSVNNIYIVKQHIMIFCVKITMFLYYQVYLVC